MRVVPSTVTWPSPVASSSADCVRGVARFTSSASTMLAKIGPAMNSKLRSFWLKMLEPVISEGSRSGVHWMRRKVPPTDVARARASIVLPVPGRSWSRTWPPATRPASASRTTRSLPTMTRWMFFSTRSRSSAARWGWRECSWDADDINSRSSLEPGSRTSDVLGHRVPKLQIGSALYVAELFSDLAVADLEQVDTAHVAAPPIEPPADDGAIAGDDHLLGFEPCPRCIAEELIPEPAHRGLADMPLAVGSRQGVLEQAVVGHERHHAVDIVAVERLVEGVDGRLGGGSIPRLRRVLIDHGRSALADHPGDDLAQVRTAFAEWHGVHAMREHHLRHLADMADGDLVRAVVRGLGLGGAGAHQVGAVPVDLERDRDLGDQAQDLARQGDFGKGRDRFGDLRPDRLLRLRVLLVEEVGVVFPNRALLDDGDPLVEVADALHVDAQTETVQQLRPQLALFRVHRPDQDEARRVRH